MTDEQSLLRAVLENPDEDLPRLILADWWDEHGQEDRAAFIRVQVEYAKACGRTIHFNSERTKAKELWGDDWEAKAEYLERRERELWDNGSYRWFGEEWRGWVLSPFARTKRQSGTISRGFISAVALSWSDWQEHASKLVWWGPRRCERCQDSLTKSEEGKRGCSACRGTGELPGATVPCETCAEVREMDFRAFGTDVGCICKRCYVPALDRSTGRIPAPLLASHQPITEVTLSTWPVGVGGGEHVAELHRMILRERWPTIQKWNLPGQPATHSEARVGMRRVTR